MLQMMRLAQEINVALEGAGYKPEQAKAQYWSKPGGEAYGPIMRIYLQGRKANGHVAIEHGRPVLRECRFSLLIEIVNDTIARHMQDEPRAASSNVIAFTR